MAQSENTAVNRLIELAQNKPLGDVDSGDDLFAAPPPARPAKRVTPPPPFRSSAQMSAMPEGTPSPELIRPRPAPVAVAAPEEPETNPFDLEDGIEITAEPVVRTNTAVVAPLPRPTPLTVEDPWFEASQAHERFEDEGVVGTHAVGKRRGGQAFWWVAGAFGLGIGLAALLFWPGSDKKGAAKKAPAAAAAPAPVAAAQPTPAIEPLAAPAAEPAVAVEPIAEAEPAPAPAAEPAVVAEPALAAPAEVTIRFESRPAGATVVLVEDGETIPLGASPVERSLDPSKRYEVMFSLEGHASVILPVEPTSGGTLWATLAAAGGAPAPAPVAVTEEADEEPAPAPVARRETKKKERVAEPKRERKTTAKPDKVAAAPGGKGKLMLAAKPPCDILIDGKKTGLTTPQRDLGLAAGKHKVTLINREHGIKESFSVTVKAGQSVRVVKDLTRKMK